MLEILLVFGLNCETLGIHLYGFTINTHTTTPLMKNKEKTLYDKINVRGMRRSLVLLSLALVELALS